jgi:hypothetical protein
MANPIETNATKILTALFENNPEQTLQFDGNAIAQMTGLNPNEINNAIDYLEDRSLIDRLNYMGTSPYNFGDVSLNSRGNFVYHEIKSPSNDKTDDKSSNIVSSQPLAAGSPYGFTDLDWEYVQKELNKINTLKVVFGYQFKSSNYNSENLRINIKKQFEEIVTTYNSQSGVVKIDLNFKPLAAGYGEHLFNQIARDIISADIAVFDTSDLNPNVMLEMGVALTWGKRVLPIKSESCPRPPSDISGQTYADYKNDGQLFQSEIHKEEMLAMVERAVMKKQRR